MWPFSRKKSLQSLPATNGGWRRLIGEPFTGAWQQNKEVLAEDVRDFFAIYACQTLISGDISKMAAEIKRKDSDGVMQAVYNAAYALMQRPNRYQNGVQFLQWWMQSKLQHGNTYVLKQRDGNGNGKLVALYILDPNKVMPMVAPDGGVYYQLNTDLLAGIEEATLLVPASEIIHDRYQPLFHPLVGVSPVYAAALAGALGKKIQEDGRYFFENGASLSGVLTAPGTISEAEAERLSKQWNSGYTGNKAGRVAVAGDGLTFTPMRAKGIDSQIVEQLKLSAEIVASCFHVPAFKIGMGTAPSKPQEGNLTYYSDCLQVLIEELEACLRDGLELTGGTIIEFDTDDLLRMDTATVIDTLAKSVGGSISTPNEARAKVGRKPLEGGDSIYMQQQNFSLAALAKRDAMPDPFSPNGGQAAGPAEPEAEVLSDSQVAALQRILESVNRGDLAAEAAKVLLRVAFPLVAQDQIDAMLQEGPAEPVAEPDETEVATKAAQYLEKALSKCAT